MLNNNQTNLLFRMDTLDFLASLENMTDTCEYFRDILEMPDTVDIFFCMVFVSYYVAYTIKFH